MELLEASQLTPQTLERVAELFSVLSTPVRLRIISQLCAGEQNVTSLLGQIDVSQPNMSRHLNVLYQAGVVAKRRSGQQIFYRLADESVVSVCKSVCMHTSKEVSCSAAPVGAPV